MEKQRILIVDDSEMNRALLTDILEGEYDVREAENGVQAIEILGENEKDFWFVLLDIMMPEMDGFSVLNYINKQHWIDRVVVIIISSDDSPENTNRAYSLGAFDYISRPFNPVIIRKRIANTMFLYARQHDLEKTVEQEFRERQKNNELMVSILSHIVEFRNGESGLHIQNVKFMTELLLRHLTQLTDKYTLSAQDIELISMASAMHDIGKICIQEEILNKPGRLTAEEFDIMKTHSVIGAKMMSELPIRQQDEPLVKVAYEICRWHHERYDGRGYPDGLKGDEIPISAQVVAMCDVYDALTSERCYKKAISHEDAIVMILEGKCGAFNPILLQCLREIGGRLKEIREKASLKEILYLGNKTDSAPERPKHEELFNQSGYMQLLYVDRLTGAYNRRYYREYVQNNSGIKAVAIVDIEHFKQINQTYGQAVGDAILRSAAQNLMSRIRKNDTLIRYGGDEFLIAFSCMKKEAFASRLEAIRRSFESLCIGTEPQLRLEVSIGGIYGTENAEALFRAVEDVLERTEYAPGQVTMRFLDTHEECADTM